MTTTYFDPTGTPGRIYGSTLVDVTGSGTISAGAPEIPNATGWTVVVITTTTGNQAINMPSTTNVGDIVECYCPNGGNAAALLFLPSGETWMGGSSSLPIRGSNGKLIRKISSTVWAPITPEV